MLKKLVEIKNSTLDYILNLTDSEILVRKCTDSDLAEVSQEYYSELLFKLQSTHFYDKKKTLDFLYARVFYNPAENPVRVFKCIDFIQYLLKNGDKEIERTIRTHTENFRSLKQVRFCQSSLTRYLPEKIEKFSQLLTDEELLDGERAQINLLTKTRNFTKPNNMLHIDSSYTPPKKNKEISKGYIFDIVGPEDYKVTPINMKNEPNNLSDSDEVIIFD